ncbi:MAG: N-acyl-D-amino-acid deacylase family protein [Bryobacteraceae bacterium]
MIQDGRAQESIELLIEGGRVIDGTGRPAFRADVAVSGGRIVDVGLFGRPEGIPALNAAGLVVTPGFIDIHSHSDFTLLVDPRAQSAIAQGVTLEVVGNCGHGCAPLTDSALVKTNLYGYLEGHDLSWHTVGEYLDCLEASKPAVNVAALVPNGNLRLATAGLVDRPSTPDEVREMERLLKQGLDEGAFGYSTGLEYGVERNCSDEELIALARVTGQAGGYYATHTRNRWDEPEETIAEAIRIAQVAGVPLQISHINVVARLTDRPRWAVERTLEQVDQARARGLDVGFDVHTRLFGTTNLSAILPPWALEGGTAAIARRLKDPRTRKELENSPNLVASLARGDWEKIVISESQRHPEISRRSIAGISRDRGSGIYDTIYDLLLADVEHLHSLMILAFNYRAEDVHVAFGHPDCIVGSDAVALAVDGPLRDQTFHGAYTWASWFVRHFVTDRKILSLEEAIRRVTSLPASRVGLRDRGTIRAGNWADLAVFDPDAFAERGTTFEPNQLAVGMSHVLVNGVVTLRDGVQTGVHGGRVLRAG